MSGGLLLGMALAAVAAAVALRKRATTQLATRAAAVEAGLDFTIDLVAVVLGSGGTIRGAIETVSRTGPSSVRVAFRAILDRCESGALLADALTPASDELGPAFHSLIGALAAAERDGAPVALTLQYLAEEAEQVRRWRTEAIAKRVSVSMLAPLVICLLPAVLVGAIVPLVIVSVRQLTAS